jgi:SAM-dependent methyltransferase
MAIAYDTIKFLEDSVEELDKTNQINMLELGDQIMSPSMGKKYINSGYKTGKEYFTKFYKMNHISVDLNGNNGSLIKDLRNEDDFSDWEKYFDIITNFGTTEHVDPVEDQWHTFKIIHQSLKKNGIFYSVVPSFDYETNKIHPTQSGHCNNYYCLEFFENLAEKCKYKILYKDVIRGMCCVSMLKLEDNNFLIDCDDLIGFIHTVKNVSAFNNSSLVYDSRK